MTKIPNDDFVKEANPVCGIKTRPDCQAPNCQNPKGTAMLMFSGKWVCGDCAMRKQEELNKQVWG